MALHRWIQKNSVKLPRKADEQVEETLRMIRNVLQKLGVKAVERAHAARKWVLLWVGALNWGLERNHSPKRGVIFLYRGVQTFLEL